MATPIGLASEARSTGGDPYRPRKRGTLHGWRPLSASQARRAPRVATPSASQARRAPRVATPSASHLSRRRPCEGGSEARSTPSLASVMFELVDDDGADNDAAFDDLLPVSGDASQVEDIV